MQIRRHFQTSKLELVEKVSASTFVTLNVESNTSQPSPLWRTPLAEIKGQLTDTEEFG